MNSIVWWSTFSLVVIAAVIDVRCRRIPNWLVVPFLVAAMVFGVGMNGMAGLGKSLGGIAVAALALGALCALKGIGMGDLKLCAAVGAWIGPAQLVVALVVMAIAGGLMAIVRAALDGEMKESLDGAGDLLFGFHRRGFRPHPTLALDHTGARRMPYAPAILIGTLFSFFTS
jgi:prepilin peptidase CpaA